MWTGEKEGIWVQLKQTKAMWLQSEKQIHREKKTCIVDVRDKNGRGEIKKGSWKQGKWERENVECGRETRRDLCLAK